jgi:hypothetical protein
LEREGRASKIVVWEGERRQRKWASVWVSEWVREKLCERVIDWDRESETSREGWIEGGRDGENEEGKEGRERRREGEGQRRREVGACILYLLKVRLSSVGSKLGARDPPILIQLVLTRPWCFRAEKVSCRNKLNREW